MSAPAPRTIGRYLVLCDQDHDGVGRSLLAYDPELDRKVVLRLLPPGDPAGAALLHEARLLGRVRHPGVLAVRDSGTCEAGTYVALEHAGGGTLAGWLAARPPAGAILGRFRLIGEALAAAHAAGLVHGRLDAGDVLLSADGAPRLRGLRPPTGDGEAAEDQRALCAALAAALEGAAVPGALRRALRRGQDPASARRFPDLPALLSALRRVGRPAWRRHAPLAVALAALALLAGYGQWRRVRCGGAERHLAGLLDEGRRAATRRAFLGSGRPQAAEGLRVVEEALAAFPARWASEHRAACEESARRGQPEDALELRMGCLQRRLDDLRALTELLAAADGRVVDRAAQATLELTDLASCRDLDAQRASPVLRDATRGPEVEAIRAQLRRAQLILNTGRRREALALIDGGVADAERVGFAPALVEALVRAGQARLTQREARLAEDLLRRAALLGERHGYDTAVPVALVMLMHAAELQADRGAMDDYASWAAAALRRCDHCSSFWPTWHRRRATALLTQGRYREAAAAHEELLSTFGEPSAGRLDLHNNLGRAYLKLGALERALVHLQRSLALREARLGPAHPSLAAVLDNVAEANDRLGRFPEALRAAERELDIARALGAEGADLGESLFRHGWALSRLGREAEGLREMDEGLRLAERALGPAHPDLAAMLTGRGELLLQLGRPREATPDLERALAMAAGLDHPEQGPALVALGRARLELGDAGGAALLERALAATERWPLPPATEGAACVALARARPGGRPDAAALLERARARYAGLGPGYAPERAAVDGWLARRRADGR